jgi:hypothetical protein
MKPINVLAKEFTECTLPCEEWTHAAHLRVGLWHLLHMPRETALDTLRERIKSYNIACGKENTETKGYHETITRFFVWAIYDIITKAEPGTPVETLEAQVIEQLSDKNFILQYYSENPGKSSQARLHWVEPDLKPLN